MNLNMDLTQHVIIDSESLEWEPSPIPGIEHRKLEREASESGRATSLVRYAPNSHFPPHTHTGGEEFLVLEGVFSDETGDYGPGSYVRNPIGSKHKPYSDDGCIIFVKLNQFDPEDTEFVRIDTARVTWPWDLIEGISILPLHEFGTEYVNFVKWEPGIQIPHDLQLGADEIFVLDGAFEDNYGRHPKGTWIRSQFDIFNTPFSSEGCTLWMKTGHLPPVTNHE